MLDTIAHFLISPINQILLGICLGVILIKVVKQKRWIGKCVLWSSVIWAALCSQYFFSYLLIAPLEKAFPPVQVQSEQWQNADLIWVLACYHYDAESLPLVSQFNACSIERLVQAANMYRVKQMPIYLTGGNFNANTELEHASQAGKFLVELGVNVADIVFVNKGRNTLSEAIELSKYIKQQKVAVVSSATHGIRLSKILTHSKVNFIFVPVHFATKGENVFTLNMPSIEALRRSERAFYEYAALVKYKIVK